jgi:hypothetical protein
MKEKLKSSPYLERAASNKDLVEHSKSTLKRFGSDAKLLAQSNSILNDPSKIGASGSKPDLSPRNWQGSSNAINKTPSDNKLSQNYASSNRLQRKMGSDNRIHSRPNLLSMPSGSLISWKLNKQASTDLRPERHFAKDLPKTSVHYKKYAPVNFKHHKNEIISMCEAMKEQLTKSSPQKLLFNFLLSHSYKILKFLDSIHVDTATETNWLRELSMSDMTDLNAIICAWEKVQEKYIDQLSLRDQFHHELLQDFETLEESNLLFKDFVEQKSKYSPDRTIDIQVQQVIKEVVEVPAPSTATDAPNQVYTREVEDRYFDFSHKEIQTDPVDGEFRMVDVMDKATGPDREIPVYRNASVFADMRHPIEDVHDKLLKEYKVLEQDNQSMKRDVEVMISGMRRDFENQLKGASYDATV